MVEVGIFMTWQTSHATPKFPASLSRLGAASALNFLRDAELGAFAQKFIALSDKEHDAPGLGIAHAAGERARSRL
jgi:hypothetical protein